MIDPTSSISLPTEIVQLLEQCDEALAAFNKLKPLDNETQARIKHAFLPDRVTASLNMEGIIATRRQTLAILDSMTVDQNSTRAEQEILNALKADEFVFDHVEKDGELSESFIRHINMLIEDKVGENPGQYRDRNVKITQAEFTPPEHNAVAGLVSELVDVFRKENSSHPILSAAWLHNRFTFIHPFLDGNGRTGRLLQDFCLMSGGFFPTGIPSAKRDDYYDALASADDGDWSGLVEIIAQRQLTVIANANGIANERKQRSSWIAALAKRADSQKQRSQHKNYLVWAHKMTEIKSAFEEAARELSASSSVISVRHDNYDLVDFNTWKEICTRGRASKTWFFSQTFLIDGEKFFRCIFYFKRHWNLPNDPFPPTNDLVSLFVTGGAPFDEYNFAEFSDSEIRLREILKYYEDIFCYYSPNIDDGTDNSNWEVVSDKSNLRVVQDFYEDILVSKFGV